MAVVEKFAPGTHSFYARQAPTLVLEKAQLAAQLRLDAARQALSAAEREVMCAGIEIEALQDALDTLKKGQGC